MSKKREEILNHLKEKFDGRVNIPIKEAAPVLGYSAQTIYNQTCRKAVRRFPIPAVRMSGRSFLNVFDMADLLSGEIHTER